MRFRGATAIQAGFMSLFRDAESRVRVRHSNFYAEAIVTLFLGRPGTSREFEACLQARDEGLAGIDFIPIPYDSETDWSQAYQWAETADIAGLGITAHAGKIGK